MIMQYKFQQSSYEPSGASGHYRMVDIQLLADPGTHSAHCAADRGLSQVQFLVWLSCACCYATTSALVGARRNCGVPQLQCLWFLSSSWTRLLCPSVQRLWVAQSWFDYAYMFCIIQVGFWKNLDNFLLEGVDWILRSLLVASLLAHMPKSAAHAVDNGSGMLFAGFAGISSHLELGSRRLPACRHAHGEKCAQ